MYQEISQLLMYGDLDEDSIQRGWMQHRDVPEPESEFYTWR